jgi:hypothetical protein
MRSIPECDAGWKVWYALMPRCFLHRLADMDEEKRAQDILSSIVSQPQVSPHRPKLLLDGD